MRKIVLLLFCVSHLFGQTIGFGTDPCNGGATWTINDARASISTLRYGVAFDCTVQASGLQVLVLDFVEPNATGPGQRIFDVMVNKQLSISGLDLYAAGGTSIDKLVSRPVLVNPTSDGLITISLKAKIIPGSTHNSAVLSRITLLPWGGSLITGQPCTVAAGAQPTQMAKLPDGTCLPIITVSPATVVSVLSDAATKIVGPVIPIGQGPWGYYEKAEEGNVRDIRTTGLAFKPQLGLRVAGTFALGDGCDITLTGVGASEFKFTVVSASKSSAAVFKVVGNDLATGDVLGINGASGDWAAVNGHWTVTKLSPDTFSIPVDSSSFAGDFDGANVYKWYRAIVVAPNAAEGPATGRLFFYVRDITGDVITSETQCGLSSLGIVPASGLVAYHCEAGCSSAYYDPGTATKVFDLGWWLMASGWNFYDVGNALYLYALRTGNPIDMEKAREWIDTYWIWALNQGSTWIGDPMYANLLSQFIRALDGKPERLPALYGMIKRRWDGTEPIAQAMANGDFDNRETGYMLQWPGLGAIADSDPVRRKWYCSTLETNISALLPFQKPEGYWSERNPGYYYRPPGVSPWRNFAMAGALARGYDALSDPGICNNSTLAAATLTALSKMAEFTYTYGRTADRGMYYDVQYENDGQHPTPRSGTVSATLNSSVITGSGTKFLTDVSVGKYITVKDYPNYTSKVKAIVDDAHLVIANNYSDAGDGLGPTHDAVNVPYATTEPAITSCGPNSVAKTCMADLRPRDYTIDSIWMMGWLYKTTRLAKWKAYGDELASATYGGEAGGPGASYPSAPGACGGPGCDGGSSAAYSFAISGCAGNPGLVPCNPDSNHVPPLCYNNATCTLGKYFGQGSGQGGFDNYLAWRLLPAR